MKKNIIIANWKMSLTDLEAIELSKKLVKKLKKQNEVDVAICPSHTALDRVASEIKRSEIKLGAQNCFWEDTGSFTGAISPKVLNELNCSYVIIGHSERREHLNETDGMVNKKVKAALANNLIPIICVGETFSERQEGHKDFKIMEQVSKAIKDVELNNKEIIIAYEPVWVIGSGQAVEPVEAEHTMQVIRQVIIDNFSPEIFDTQVRLIYGGSIDKDNILEFVNQPSIEGALVGGASLDVDKFVPIIDAK
ncbi:triose-phosphate isomerase [bacterium]|jgi:triosephosphate isomerase|nr:triose-phosphate isomerase [bacterium]MBT4121768.1 triose-phosphate isomerase [bacterium]MBT4334869.1 triose-phosphate isomerase [bacterium]MBT4495180.1 triose-phosphate isomerase [bacterium]MBT4763975.1 triose-phosphate isomerase [bacterium]